jgi:hypothetical protein
MKQFVAFVMMWLILLATACTTPAPTVTPTPAARATWTPSAIPTALAKSEPPAPSSPSAVPTNTSTATPIATATATATLPPTNSPTVAPGLYVTSLRFDPNPPLRGSDLNFYVTFLNTTGAVQNFRWLAYIYKPEDPTKLYGQSTAGLFQIPVGTSELRSVGPWRLALGGPCEDLLARIVWLDQNNKAINFTQPNGQVFEKNFRICAPSDLPSATPGPSPTPTATPTFAPGLFVDDVRTEPNPPTRGSDLNFIVTFVNTIGSPQNMKWNVYIYRPGENNSIGETATTTTVLGIGINDYRVNGAWKLPLGGPCENFVVRVGWFDNENKLHMFTRFENLVFEKPITVCPP